MARAVIFDLDGVLFDTEPLTALCMQCVLRESGLPEFSTAELAASVGVAGSYRRMLSERSVPAAAIERLLQESHRRFEQAALALPPMPGVARLLCEIRREGLRLALASGARRTLILSLLSRAQLLEQFEFIVGFEDVPRHKPHPMPYLVAAAGVGTPPADCVAIEDSPTGIASARAAGCKVLVVTSAQHAAQEQSGADHTLADLTGCRSDWLKGL